MKILNLLVIYLFIFLSGCVISTNAFYPFKRDLLRKLNRQDGLVFDASTVLRKIYIDEIKKSMEEYYQPKFDLNLSNMLSRNILKIAHNIGTLIMEQQSMDEKFIAFSPLSIASALALLLLGSNDHTNDELMQLFGFDKSSTFQKHRTEIHDQFGFLIEDLLNGEQNPKRIRPVDPWKYITPGMEEESGYSKYLSNQHKIEIANGIFIQKGFPLKSQYQQNAERIYRGEIKSVDFEGNPELARKIINDWAAKRTNGRVHEILSEGVPAKTNMILASTLYFRALWENSFLAEVTSKRQFYPDGKNKESIFVDTMFTSGEFPYYDAQEDGFRIIGLPYKGNQTTMYVILPYDSSKGKLRNIQRYLNAERIEEVISKMEMISVFLSLPKMHLESSINLKDILHIMGVHSIFNSYESDLSLIADNYEQDEQQQQQQKREDKPPVISRLSHSGNIDKDVIKDEPFIFNRFGGYDAYEEDYEEKRREVYNIEKDSINKRQIDSLINDNIGERATYGQGIRYVRDLGDRDRHPRRRSKRSKNPRIFVDDILHKSDLTIDEKGTEGAAVTFSYFNRNSMDIDFRVDSPFLFLIRHDATRLPLFYGSVYHPIT